MNKKRPKFPSSETLQAVQRQIDSDAARPAAPAEKRLKIQMTFKRAIAKIAKNL